LGRLSGAPPHTPAVAAAFPPKAPINAASLYPGPRKLYEDAGFIQVGELDKRWVMRRTL
jgi:hypothetical protein